MYRWSSDCIFEKIKAYINIDSFKIVSTTHENHIICEFLNCFELKYENIEEAIKINVYLKYQKDKEQRNLLNI